MRHLLAVLLALGILALPVACQKTPEPAPITIALPAALSNGKITLAEFGSNSCIPCREMKPILEDLANMYDSQLNVVIIDVYEQKALTQQYGILGIPTQIVFDSSGKEVTRHVGVWSLSSILVQLRSLGLT
ncbi:thioredoxin family protein [Dehalogenimonas alkenigignens]|uniref:Thioredoxin n=1 Tax=Dehalogenimonas alkenigignens TaxID=1217799 RepID=A0A0W0GHL5_9CHLR|nr:thioredoxin family protein [Dehalogenimonas alkenigignens]KTB48042.1 Thioredoxin [Dehalogenimonas alkenigignens]